MNIGDRVGAIASANEKEVFFYGYGTYEGEKVPEELNWPYPNLCILLDSGERVYGVECWWGSENRVKNLIGDRKVTLVNIKEKRNEAHIS